MMKTAALAAAASLATVQAAPVALTAAVVNSLGGTVLEQCEANAANVGTECATASCAAAVITDTAGVYTLDIDAATYTIQDNLTTPDCTAGTEKYVAFSADDSTGAITYSLYDCGSGTPVQDDNTATCDAANNPTTFSLNLASAADIGELPLQVCSGQADCTGDEFIAANCTPLTFSAAAGTLSDGTNTYHVVESLTEACTGTDSGLAFHMTDGALNVVAEYTCSSSAWVSDSSNMDTSCGEGGDATAAYLTIYNEAVSSLTDLQAYGNLLTHCDGSAGCTDPTCADASFTLGAITIDGVAYDVAGPEFNHLELCTDSVSHSVQFEVDADGLVSYTTYTCVDGSAPTAETLSDTCDASTNPDTFHLTSLVASADVEAVTDLYICDAHANCATADYDADACTAVTLASGQISWTVADVATTYEIVADVDEDCGQDATVEGLAFHENAAGEMVAAVSYTCNGATPGVWVADNASISFSCQDAARRRLLDDADESTTLFFTNYSPTTDGGDEDADNTVVLGTAAAISVTLALTAF